MSGLVLAHRVSSRQCISRQKLRLSGHHRDNAHDLFMNARSFRFVNLLLRCALRAARTQKDSPSIVIPGSHVRISDNGVLQDHEAG
jgi:hypothetical protein